MTRVLGSRVGLARLATCALAAWLNGCGDPCEPANASVYFADEDGDGFGDGQNARAACAAPRGFVRDDADCDDTRADVFPGAEETCDATDRDCDGDAYADATDAAPYFYDGDGDGDGDPAVSVIACLRPTSSHVRRGLDCDDSDPMRSTRLVEVPYTEVDEDCDDTTPDDDFDGDGLAVADDCDDQDAHVGVPAPRTPSFTEVGLSRGLVRESADGSCLPKCGLAVQAAGAAVEDIDDDGDLDIVLVRIDAPSELLLNDGNGMFTDAASARAFDANGAFGAAVVFDLEGDGDLDVHVAAIGPRSSLLFVQGPGGSFSEQGETRGAHAPVANGTDHALHYSVSAGDVDHDGDVDLHLPAWRLFQNASTAHTQLLVSGGGGTFTRGEIDAGLSVPTAAAFTSGFFDVNDDGLTDFALAADFGTSRLFTASSAGMFTDVTTSAAVGTDENGMGSTLADYDGDGDLDWFVTSILVPASACGHEQIGCTGNRLYRNDGALHFTDVTTVAGVRDGGWGWGASFFDFDLDGDVDLGHTNGYVVEGHRAQRMRLFVSDGAGHFENAACAHGLWGMGQGRAFIPFDMERDGDLDLLVTRFGERPLLYRNESADGRAWLEVRLRDQRTQNTRGLGAVVTARATPLGPVQRRDVHASSTFAGVGPAEAHFGFGAHEGALAELTVVWPDGEAQLLTNVAMRQVLVITRGP